MKKRKPIMGVRYDSWTVCQGDCRVIHFCINHQVHIEYVRHYDGKIEDIEYSLCSGHEPAEAEKIPDALVQGYLQFLKDNHLREVDQIIPLSQTPGFEDLFEPLAQIDYEI